MSRLDRVWIRTWPFVAVALFISSCSSLQEMIARTPEAVEAAGEVVDVGEMVSDAASGNWLGVILKAVAAIVVAVPVLIGGKRIVVKKLSK